MRYSNQLDRKEGLSVTFKKQAIPLDHWWYSKHRFDVSADVTLVQATDRDKRKMKKNSRNRKMKESWKRKIVIRSVRRVVCGFYMLGSRNFYLPKGWKGKKVCYFANSQRPNLKLVRERTARRIAATSWTMPH